MLSVVRSKATSSCATKNTVQTAVCSKEESAQALLLKVLLREAERRQAGALFDPLFTFFDPLANIIPALI